MERDIDQRAHRLTGRMIDGETDRSTGRGGDLESHSKTRDLWITSMIILFTGLALKGEGGVESREKS